MVANNTFKKLKNLKKPYMLIDCSSVAYRAFFTMGGLSTGTNKKTGVIFGFLGQILNLAKKFETNKFIFCFDSSKSYRKVLYPDYKKKRDELTEAEKKEKQLFYNQINRLRIEVLPALGFKNVLIKTGFEADDLIAYTIKQNKNRPMVICSTDQDLYQLLDYEVFFYDIDVRKGKGLLDKVWFEEEYYHLHPMFWGEMKAIAGCSTDGVPGIKGIGEQSALRHLAGELNPGKKLDSIKSESGQKIIERNKPLVILPFKRKGKKEPEFKIQGGEKFKRKIFIDLFDDLEFVSFLKKLDDWQEHFKLK